MTAAMTRRMPTSSRVAGPVGRVSPARRARRQRARGSSDPEHARLDASQCFRLERVRDRSREQADRRLPTTSASRLTSEPPPRRLRTAPRATRRSTSPRQDSPVACCDQGGRSTRCRCPNNSPRTGRMRSEAVERLSSDVRQKHDPEDGEPDPDKVKPSARTGKCDGEQSNLVGHVLSLTYSFVHERRRLREADPRPRGPAGARAGHQHARPVRQAHPGRLGRLRRRDGAPARRRGGRRRGDAGVDGAERRDRRAAHRARDGRREGDPHLDPELKGTDALGTAKVLAAAIKTHDLRPRARRDRVHGRLHGHDARAARRAARAAVGHVREVRRRRRHDGPRRAPDRGRLRRGRPARCPPSSP